MKTKTSKLRQIIGRGILATTMGLAGLVGSSVATNGCTTYVRHPLDGNKRHSLSLERLPSEDGQYNPESLRADFGLPYQITKLQILDENGKVAYDIGENDFEGLKEPLHSVYWRKTFEELGLDPNKRYFLRIEDRNKNLFRGRFKVEEMMGIRGLEFDRQDDPLKDFDIFVRSDFGITKLQILDENGKVAYDIGERDYNNFEEPLFSIRLERDYEELGLDPNQEYSLYAEDRGGDKRTIEEYRGGDSPAMFLPWNLLHYWWAKQL